MRRKRSLQRLLEVVVRLEVEASGAATYEEMAFGPVVTSSETFPDLSLGAPPIGSDEFEHFMDELVRLEKSREAASTAADAGTKPKAE